MSEIILQFQVALSKSQFAQLLDTLNGIGAASTETSMDQNGLIEEQNHNSIQDSEGELKYGVHFAIQEFIVEFTEEPGRAFARVAFQEFDLEMIRHSKQSDVNVSSKGEIFVLEGIPWPQTKVMIYHTGGQLSNRQPEKNCLV